MSLLSWFHSSGLFFWGSIPHHNVLAGEDQPLTENSPKKNSGFCLQGPSCTWGWTYIDVHEWPVNDDGKKKKRKIQPAACEDRMKRIISHLHCQRIYFKTQAKRTPTEIMIDFVSSVQGYKGLIKAKFSITINDSPSAPSKSRSRQSLARLISWAHGEP